MKFKFVPGFLIMCLLINYSSFAQQNISTEKIAKISSFDSTEILPLDTAVVTGVLPNGFKYYIRRNTKPENRAIFYLPMKVGSVLENEDEQGLAHFLEHMAFNGTKNYPKNDLINYLQSNGVRFGADLNAYTSFDETVYQLPLPTDNPEIIKNGLQILRDWAQDILLETEEINKERGVIMEEKRTGMGATERMQKQYLPMLLNNSRYANRLPIGKEEVILNFKPNTIRDFYKKWYKPNLQALIVVGDVNVKEIEKLIIEKFANLKNPSDATERTEYAISLNGDNQFMTVTDKEYTNTVIQVMMKHAAGDFKTTGDFRNNLIEVLFNNLMATRISELSKQAEPPFLQGGSNIGNFMAGLNAASIVASVKPGKLEQGFKAVLTETERVKKMGFTQTELDRIKQAILNYQESKLKEKGKITSDSYMNGLLKLFLKGQATPGLEYEYNFYKKNIPLISLEEVNNLARKYYTKTNRDILIMAPENQKDSLPSEATVLKWIQDVKSSNLTAYSDSISGKSLLTQKPEPGKIIKEKSNKVLGLKELTLSNGVKVILKPTNFKNDEIRFSSFSPGGNSLYGDNDYQSVVNASGIIASSGLGEFSAIDLPKVISGKIVSISPYISERFEGINGSAAPADLETAMKLVYLFFTEPRIDSNIFKGLVSNYKSSLTNRANDPNSVFSDTANAILSNYSVRRTGPTIEKANEISLERLFEIYKDRFADASDFTFLFVGNINEDSIRPLLETYLGSLPSIKRKEEPRDLGIRIPSGRIKKIVYKGKENKAFVQLVFSGDYKYGVKENVEMDALEEILKLRLTERLRENEGGVYSPGVSINYGQVPVPKYNVSIYFECAPENVDKLIVATLEEVKMLQIKGADIKDINKFISEEKRSRQTKLKTNDFWLSYLTTQYEHQSDLDDVFKYDKKLEKVNQQDIKKTATKYLNPQNFIQLILMPEANDK